MKNAYWPPKGIPKLPRAIADAASDANLVIFVGDGQAVVIVLSNVAPPVRGRQATQYILDRETFYSPNGLRAEFFPWLRPIQTTEERVADFMAFDGNADGSLEKPELGRML